MGTNARTHAKGLVREASRQRVLLANSKCPINTRWQWVLVVWPKLLVRALGLGRSSGWMVAKQRLEPWFFPPELWSTDRWISSQHGPWGIQSEDGAGLVVVSVMSACLGWSWFPSHVVAPPWGHRPSLLTQRQAPLWLKGPRGHGEGQPFCCFERLSCFTSWLFLGRSTCLCALLVQTPAGKWGQGTEVEPGSPHDQLQGPHSLSVRLGFVSPKPSHPAPLSNQIPQLEALASPSLLKGLRDGRRWLRERGGT